MIDFINIPLSTSRYNFHSHTQFCDGHATMDEFAEAAVAAGFEHYGFSPHSPIPIESPCNMKADDLPAYLDEVERLQQLYAGKIRFYAGMEIDYLGSRWGPSSDYFTALPLDYRIGSVHFIPAQGGEYIDIDGKYESFRRKMQQHFHNDILYVVNTFFDQSEAMIEAGAFDIVGHIDKIAQNAGCHCPGIDAQEWFETRVKRLITMSVDRGIIIEINTKAAAEHDRFFPDIKWWPLLKTLGAKVLVNSDAHRPELIDASRDIALRFIDR